MQTKIVFAAVLLLIASAHAQPDSLWSRAFGGANADVCNSVQQTSDGGYVLAGVTYSFGGGFTDFWLVKTDAQGDSLWSRTFGGSDFEWCTSVQQTPDSGYVLAGHTRSFGTGNYDFWLVKTDANGDSLWGRTFGGSSNDYCYSVQQTSDGGYVLAGYTYSFGAGDYDFWLVKTDAQGDSLWSRTYGGIWEDCCWSFQQTSDGGYVLAGRTSSFGGGICDFWLVKTDAQGDSLWSRTYGGTLADDPWSVQKTSDGGYVLAGYTNSFGAGDYDFWLVKTDANGDSLWSRTYGGATGDFGTSLQQTSEGGYVLAGYTYSFGAGNYDSWLVRTDANGDSLWSRTFGGSSDDRCNSVQQTSDGGYVLGGLTSSFGAGNYDSWLVRTGPELGVGEKPNPTAVRRYELHPIYPNPFNGTATITYDLPATSHVTLKVFNVLGKEVAVLKNGMQDAGRYQMAFDGENLASGVYLYRLQAGNFAETRKMVLMR